MHRRRQPHHPPAQRHRRVLHPRVPRQGDVVMRHMHRVIRPVLQAHHGQRRAVTGHDFHVVGIGRAAGMVQHHCSPRISPHLDQRVPERRPLGVLAPHRNHSRLGSLGLGGNRYDDRFLEGSEGPGADPVGGHKGGAEPAVAALRTHSGDRRVGVDLHRNLSRSGRSVTVQPSQPTQRRKPPFLFTAGRHRKVIQRERLVLVQPRHGGRRLHGPLERRHQPTAPSI